MSLSDDEVIRILQTGQYDQVVIVREACALAGLDPATMVAKLMAIRSRCEPPVLVGGALRAMIQADLDHRSRVFKATTRDLAFAGRVIKRIGKKKLARASRKRNR